MKMKSLPLRLSLIKLCVAVLWVLVILFLLNGCATLPDVTCTNRLNGKVFSFNVSDITHAEESATSTFVLLTDTEGRSRMLTSASNGYLECVYHDK